MPVIRSVKKPPRNCVNCNKKARERGAIGLLSVENPIPQPKKEKRADLEVTVTSAPLKYSRPPQLGSANEYDQLMARGGRDYSEGHRRMYTTAIEILGGSGLPPVDVLEVGAGIGYGLRLMYEAHILKTYQAVEPEPKSFAHLKKLYGAPLSPYQFWNSDLLTARPYLRPADYVFCIEVIEHVPAEQVGDFLGALRSLTLKNLFLSTPDANTSRHGVATPDEWKKAIKAARYDVVTIRRQWTTLFVCEVK